MLNAPHGLLMTTKCDRWRLSDAERVELADALDEPQAEFGAGSYIDVLMVHAVPRSDFLLHEEWVRTVALRCAALPVDHARVELVVRPAHDGAVWGAVWAKETEAMPSATIGAMLRNRIRMCMGEQHT